MLSEGGNYDKNISFKVSARVFLPGSTRKGGRALEIK